MATPTALTAFNKVQKEAINQVSANMCGGAVMEVATQERVLLDERVVLGGEVAAEGELVLPEAKGVCVVTCGFQLNACHMKPWNQFLF